MEGGCWGCRYCVLPVPGHWIPAFPAGMTVVFGFCSDARHLGRECRDPESMEGKCWECRYYILPIPGHWIPAFPAGMTGIVVFV